MIAMMSASVTANASARLVRRFSPLRGYRLGPDYVRCVVLSTVWTDI